MKKIFVFSAMAFGIAVPVHAQATPTKIAILHVQNAIVGTQEGQKAIADLSTRFAPKKAELDKKQNDLAGMQDQLKKQQATMSEDARSKLMRDIDASNTRLQRETQDAQADLDEEQQKLMQDLGNKMMAVIEKYANQNGFALVLDVSNPQTPVLWAASTVDITPEITKLYDQAHPSAAAPAGAPASKTPPTGTPTTGIPSSIRPPVAPTSTPPSAPPATKKK